MGSWARHSLVEISDLIEVVSEMKMKRKRVGSDAEPVIIVE
jgi:hypothetical protein